jgi:hypothetical protein
MKSLRAFVLFFLAMVVCAGSALADSTVDMKLVGVGGNNSGGVYTYPYYFSINGGAPVALICDSFDNRVTIGESWQANVVGLLSSKGLFGGQFIDYEAAGLIFKSILDGKISANVGNWAIWGLFSSNAKNQSYFQSSGALGVEQQYLAYAANAPKSAYNGLLLYTPISGTQSANGIPQEYIGYSPVPEPSSLMLFGTGLLGCAHVVRRRLKKATA